MLSQMCIPIDTHCTVVYIYRYRLRCIDYMHTMHIHMYVYIYICTFICIYIFTYTSVAILAQGKPVSAQYIVCCLQLCRISSAMTGRRHAFQKWLRSRPALARLHKGFISWDDPLASFEKKELLTQLLTAEVDSAYRGGTSSSSPSEADADAQLERLMDDKDEVSHTSFSELHMQLLSKALFGGSCPKALKFKAEGQTPQQ